MYLSWSHELNRFCPLRSFCLNIVIIDTTLRIFCLLPQGWHDVSKMLKVDKENTTRIGWWGSSLETGGGEKEREEMCRGGGGCLAASGNGNQYFFLPAAGKGKRKKWVRKRSAPVQEINSWLGICWVTNSMSRSNSRAQNLYSSILNSTVPLRCLSLLRDTEDWVCPTKEARIN